MALLTIPDENRTIRDPEAIRTFLADAGIVYEQWEPSQPVSPDATPGDILAAYDGEISRLKVQGGYVTADVIDITPQTPGLDAMLAKFNREHWHDEDEVRFIIRGRGLFHLHPNDGSVFVIEVEAGDLLRVPRGTLHWFNLCSDRSVRAIRLFQDPAGWTPKYTDSGADAGYEPVCLGLSYLPSQPQAT